MAGDYLLGIDLGGTKIAAGVFDLERKLLGEIVTAATQAEQPGAVTLASFEAAAAQARRLAGVSGHPRAVGVGSTGPVDAGALRVLEAPSLPNLQGFDLGAWVRERFRAPLFLENDANCFALGEALQGAGAGCRVVVAVTLGTGFGCGIVIEGAIYPGMTGNAGEVANCPVAGGTFDDMLSGGGVRRFYKRVSGRSPLSARKIGELAQAGDPAARVAWHDYGHAVGEALGTIAAVLDPSICVLGGSVAACLPLFEQPMRARLDSIVTRPVPVVPARLGTAAGVIGAAEYAHFRLRNSSVD